MKKNVLLGISLLFLLAATISVSAQSTDRDHPTRLNSEEITGSLDGGEIEYFFSFTAGPGEVTLTVDVKSSHDLTGLNFELLDRNAAGSLICCEFAQADSTGSTGRDVKSVKLAKGQRVILHLTPFKMGRGTYRVRISGASDLH